MTPQNQNDLPSLLPRPAGELAARFERAWKPALGWGFFARVNNSQIGQLYIVTALMFFVAAGVLALIMRTQLAVPDNTLVTPQLYNQLFTMHGTVMMFLFAIPAVERSRFTSCPTCWARATCRSRAWAPMRTGLTRSAARFSF